MKPRLIDIMNKEIQCMIGLEKSRVWRQIILVSRQTLYLMAMSHGIALGSKAVFAFQKNRHFIPS